MSTDIASPTGHVATYNDLNKTYASDRDIYVIDDTGDVYQFSGATVSWTKIDSIPKEEEEKSQQELEAEAPEQQAGTIGASVAGTTTLDALVAAALANKSADLAGAISYVWYTPTRVIGTFPSATSATGKVACVRVYIEPQVHAPSSWLP